MAFNFQFRFLLHFLYLSVVAATGKVDVLQNQLYNGTVTAEMVAGAASLDGVKLSSTANTTAYEWWYFDVVSTSSVNESFNVVLYNAGSEGFPRGYLDGPLSAEISGSFENGTAFAFTASAHGGAVFVDNKKGVYADWKGTGVKFWGTNLLDENIAYEVVLDSPETGIFGKITMRSRAPPRYNCTPNVPGANGTAFLNVGWANAVPDADALVDVTVGDTSMHFTGIGYHDQNWGLSPFTDDSWHTYWGHARVGPYSVVFADVQIPRSGGRREENFSGMVVKDGEFVQLSCATNAVVVRPWGGNDEYPPKVSSPPPLGIELTFDLGNNSTLYVNVTNDLMVDDQAYYQRFVGSAKGSVDDGEIYEGRSLYEQFRRIE